MRVYCTYPSHMLRPPTDADADAAKSSLRPSNPHGGRLSGTEKPLRWIRQLGVGVFRANRITGLRRTK